MYWRRHGHRDGRGGVIALRLAPAALDDIAAHARLAAPAECCGLLVGTTTDIVESVPSANLAPEPVHNFLLDPATHIDARRQARARGLTVVGFYHSHPDSEPTPSQKDVEGASYTDHVYLIVRPLPSGCLARLFRWADEGFAEVDVIVE